MDLFHRDFGTTRVSAFDTEHALVDQPTLVALVKDNQLAGALAYRLSVDALQMLALATDPMWQRAWANRPPIKNGIMTVSSDPGFGIVLD